LSPHDVAPINPLARSCYEQDQHILAKRVADDSDLYTLSPHTDTGRMMAEYVGWTAGDMWGTAGVFDNPCMRGSMRTGSYQHTSW
jgi:hypothetical protein